MRRIAVSHLDSGDPSTEDRGTQRYGIPEIAVGKDVLELVSTAMYVDPMTVYREYIQNAADAIDTARKTSLLVPDGRGRVDISVDAGARTVRIRDNGCGLAFEDFARQLTALGGSAKRGGSLRGFRGVGRLAGLAYARELAFRSAVAGEKYVSQLKWDCRRLRAALREEPYDSGIAELVREVATLERVKSDELGNSFFEVEMRGVVRLGNDRLMNPGAISEYISQVAPVPFAAEFRFGAEISKRLSDYVALGDLDISINGGDPVCRPHRDRLKIERGRALNFQELSLLEIPGLDSSVAAVAWVLHHEYAGIVPAATLVKGVRVRTGNLQVGGHAVLENVFPEPRFNSWSVGEVHVIDSRIVPNGRRDSFEENVHFNSLLNHLVPLARDLAHRCRTSSVRRRHTREFELSAESVAGKMAVIAQRSTGGSQREQLALSAQQTLLAMARIASKRVLIGVNVDYEERIALLRRQLAEAMEDDAVVSSPLMRLPAREREAYEHFFELVYECSTNRVAAKALIDRILLKLKSTAAT